METSTPSANSTRRTAILLVVVAFVAGALIGVAGDRMLILARGRLFSERGMAAIQHRIVSRLDRELKLSPQQRASVDQILTRHHARMRQISEGIRPQMAQEIDAANREISSILTPEQRQKFDSMRMHMRRGGHHDRNGGPPSPGL